MQNSRLTDSRFIQRRAAFTLVEILIVLAVIAILAAILFPVMGRAREMGRRTSCVSNMKQIGMAFQQYAADANDRLPLAVDGGFGPSKPNAWTYYTTFGSGNGTIGLSTDVPPVFDPGKGSLFPYVRATSVYVCPSDNGGRLSGQSYAANSCVFEKKETDELTGAYRVGKKLSRFRNPSEWMLLSEEARDKDDRLSSTDDAYLNLIYEASGTASYQNSFSQRHFNGSVLAFMDGHAKWYPLEKITNDKFQIGGPRVTKTLADGCPLGVQ